jgi:hypothetical protein
MMTRRVFRHVIVCAALALAGSLAAVPAAPVRFEVPARAETLPRRLTNQEFWKLVSEFSEPGGTFHSDNLVSNEARFQYVMPALVRAVKPGGAYLGVGPEQNFTYMAAVRPAVAFIVDLRRGNRDLHLMYKALFELSADRAEFVSRLFAKPRPAGLTAAASAAQLFAAYEPVAASRPLYDRTLAAIKRHLLATHGFALASADVEGVEFVYDNMFMEGPEISYRLYGRGGRGFPNYADLMRATDASGRAWSYLASEDAYKFLKDLQTRNMVVPVVGNFSGPKALRAVGSYLKQKETIVSAFYTSNVEQYLRQDRLWGVFCANVATLPLNAASTFIRSSRGGFVGQAPVLGPGFTSELKPVDPDLAGCAAR